MDPIETKLAASGLVLPAPIQLPPGVIMPFSWVRLRGRRAMVSGHVALDPGGALARPAGKVGETLTLEQGYQSARLTGLAMLASLKRALGDLDRIGAWLRVFGMVNTAPAFTDYPSVINGFSDLVLELYGPERGSHARSAVGLAGLPFGMPVEIEAEVEID